MTKGAGARGEKGKVVNPTDKTAVENPVDRVLWQLGVTRFDAAAYLGISYSRFCAIASGAAILLPRDFVTMVEKYLGPGRGAKLETDWQAFRASLSAEVKADLEARFFPTGRVYDMQNVD